MKHAIAAIVLLAATTGAHLSIQRSQEQAYRDKAEKAVPAVPSVIGPYTQYGPDYEVAPRTKELLQSSLIVMRQYRSPRRNPLFLTLVYAGTSRKSLHFPEVCLVGQGWEIRDQAPAPLGFKFTAKRLMLVKGNQKEAVVYFFKTGDQYTGNFFLNAWYWARNQVSRGAPTSAMIKLHAPVARGQNEETVFATLEDFALKLTPILSKVLK